MERKKGIMMSYHAPDRGYIWLDPSVNMFKNFEDGIWKPVATNITYSKVEQLIVEQQKINAKLDTFTTKFSELDTKIANITSDVQNISNTIGDVNTLRTSEKIIVGAINEVYKMITGSNSIDVTDLLEGRSMTTSIDKLAESHLYAQGSPSEIEVHIIKHPRGYYLYWDTADLYIAEDSDHGIITRQYMTIIQHGAAVQPQLDSLRTIRIGLSDFEIEDITASIDSKQDILVSGTNIKTINGLNILGNGNIEIQGGGAQSKMDKVDDIEYFEEGVDFIDKDLHAIFSIKKSAPADSDGIGGNAGVMTSIDKRNLDKLKAQTANIEHFEEVFGTDILTDAAVNFADALLNEQTGIIPDVQNAITVQQLRIGEIESTLGDMSSLQTTDKSSLVAAINDAYNHGGGTKESMMDKVVGIDYTGSTARFVDKDSEEVISISYAVPTDDNYMGGSAGLMTAEDKHELDYISAHMGYLPALETQAKDDLVSAINEAYNHGGGSLEWYGTQAEFEALEEYTEGMNYYIIDDGTTPTLTSYMIDDMAIPTFDDNFENGIATEIETFDAPLDEDIITEEDNKDA